jgi:thiol-disulfide isomerase/thioredoxin
VQNPQTKEAQKEPIIREQKQNKKENILALYYADWCGYSKIFLPEWEKIKNSANSGELGNIKCVQFECTEQKDECMKNSIKGFPSMILHKIDGANINYPDTSPRTLDAVKKFLNNNL